jgi:Popeye protein conserved region
MGALSGQTVAEILTHSSCALSFGAFLVRDMLWLRLLAISSSLVWIAAMVANNWITASFFWNGIFIAINTYNIGVLLHENRSVSFTDEERELYETLFRFFEKHPALKAGCHSVITDDLRKKLLRGGKSPDSGKCRPEDGEG